MEEEFTTFEDADKAAAQREAQQPRCKACGKPTAICRPGQRGPNAFNIFTTKVPCDWKCERIVSLMEDFEKLRVRCAGGYDAMDRELQENRRKSDLLEELTGVLNQHCAENDSNTPDYILAEYLLGCLRAFNVATTAREKWHGRGPQPAPPPEGAR